jgi:hypothetical protein
LENGIEDLFLYVFPLRRNRQRWNGTQWLNDNI